MDVLSYIRDQGGYVRLKDLKKVAIQTRDIRRLINRGDIEKIKPGLYRLAELADTVEENISLIDVCRAIPNGIICLLSALDYYDLTTFNPSRIYTAIPHAAKPPQMEYPPVKVYFFRERFYSPGMQVITTRYGPIQIYSPEKTICDMFRYRNKLGEDLALEALRNYLRRDTANINLLRSFADICQVRTIMLPYLKAMLVDS